MLRMRNALKKLIKYFYVRINIYQASLKLIHIVLSFQPKPTLGIFLFFDQVKKYSF